MTYKEFSEYLAKYGFIANPIDEKRYEKIANLSLDALYGIVCDVNAGISFARAVAINKDRETCK
jgi:hypothetical protein